MNRKARSKKPAKKKNEFASIKIKPSKELQKALDLFPKIVKRNEKAAREKQRIIKNFLRVEDKIFPDKPKRG